MTEQHTNTTYACTSFDSIIWFILIGLQSLRSWINWNPSGTSGQEVDMLMYRSMYGVKRFISYLFFFLIVFFPLLFCFMFTNECHNDVKLKQWTNIIEISISRNESSKRRASEIIYRSYCHHNKQIQFPNTQSYCYLRSLCTWQIYALDDINWNGYRFS